MPNYYIQARRGTFNPFSFDEYVKPLNMYKEYYEKNEEAITDMQEQANLWKNIMESEKDSKLADKYNTYVNNLNNATQQLKNGMSYNLRNQIQQLRGQSAMVKQIENAYNLRAKDIDTYNELMLKDPSRIGAYDPSQRKLQEYLNGPVTNEYGVSGDRLYALGNARAKAMSAQRDKFYEPVSALGKQYFELKETTGYSDKEITQMLKNHNPEIFNEIDRIIQQEGTSLNNANDLNTAETYILNGMLSGFTYDEDRKYMKNEDYKLEIEQNKKDIEGLNDIIKELQNTHSVDFGVLRPQVKSQLENNKLFYDENGNLVAEENYDIYKDMFSGKINGSDIMETKDNDIITNELYDIFTYYNNNKEEVFDNDIYNEFIKAIKEDVEGNTESGEYARTLLNEGAKDDKEIEKRNKLYNELYELYSILKDVPDKNDYSKYTKFVDYYNTVDARKISGIDYYENETEAKKVRGIISEKILNNAEYFKLDKDKGFIEEPESINDKMKKAISESLVATDYGYLAKVGDDVYLVQTPDVDANKYNITMATLNDLVNVENMKKIYRESEKDKDGYIALRNGYLLKIEDGKYKIKIAGVNETPATINLYNVGEIYDYINTNIVKESKRLYNTAVGDKSK